MHGQNIYSWWRYGHLLLSLSVRNINYFLLEFNIICLFYLFFHESNQFENIWCSWTSNVSKKVGVHLWNFGSSNSGTLQSHLLNQRARRCSRRVPEHTTSCPLCERLILLPPTSKPKPLFTIWKHPLQEYHTSLSHGSYLTSEDDNRIFISLKLQFSHIL